MTESSLDPPQQTQPGALPAIVGIAALAFGLDQLTKYMVLVSLDPSQSWSYLRWLAPLFKITFIHNTGAAFGMFPQAGTILMIIAVVVVAGIIFYHHHLPVENVWIRVALGLQLGGALGNLLDRVIHGYVVDFIDIGFWPIFNIADMSIVIGVSILAYFLWDEDEPDRVSSSGRRPL